MTRRIPGQEDGDAEPGLWALVLAGGDGRRLRGLVRAVHGDERPKQFAAPDGGHSLLTTTLERAGRIAQPDRTVVMVRHEHGGYLADAVETWSDAHWLFQPAERGTAVAILWGALWIAARDPGATVAILPSDHHLADEDTFADHLLAVAAAVRPGETVLFGAPADGPETGYGWIEVRAATLVRLVATTLPDVADVVTSFAACPIPGGAFAQAFHACRPADFSGEVLERLPGALLVSPLPPVGWADWGTPARVLRSLRDAGIRPAWAAGLGEPADEPAGRPTGPAFVGRTVGTGVRSGSG